MDEALRIELGDRVMEALYPVAEGGPEKNLGGGAAGSFEERQRLLATRKRDGWHRMTGW